MQAPMRVTVFFACIWCSLANVLLVQKKVEHILELNGTDRPPSSTCTKSSGPNTYDACPQEKCFGQCCLTTGMCATFLDTICPNPIPSGFPPTSGTPNPSGFHHSYHYADGCTCAPKNTSNCVIGTSGSNCWGTLQCTNPGTCRTTQQCTDGKYTSNVGDFCMLMAVEGPVCFKFCGSVTTSTTTSAPTLAPTFAPTLSPTIAPTPLPTPEPTPTPTPSPTLAPTLPLALSTTTTTTCSTYRKTLTCELYTDPHLIGFDNSENGPASLSNPIFYVGEMPFSSSSGNSGFSGHPIYLDVGDYWLIKSELLSIQGRYVPSAAFKEGGAVVGAIGIGGPVLDGKRLVIEPRNGGVTWDSHTLPFGAFNTHLLHGDVTVLNGEQEVRTLRPFSQVVIHLPMSIDLMVNRYDTYLNVKITMPEMGLLSAANIEGQCGNSNGVEEDDTLPEIDRRMHGSIVLPQQSLFD